MFLRQFAEKVLLTACRFEFKPKFLTLTGYEEYIHILFPVKKIDKFFFLAGMMGLSA